MIAVAFEVPWWWPLLLLLPVAVWIGWRRAVRRRALQRRTFGGTEHRLLGVPTLVGARALLGVGFVVALAIALLRPVGGTESGEPAGPDVVFCLDVSWSMAAQDVPPARLRRAVAAIEATAAAAPGARFGLVAFAGEARLLVPLSKDLDAVTVMAGQLAPGAELRGGTDLGAAIGLAAVALQRGLAGAGSVVLLTDGEDFGDAGRDAAASARAAGLIVHCLGYGTATGSKIAVETEAGQQFLRDASGVEVISALDDTTLRAVAAAGGGDYAAGTDPNALTALYRDRLQPRAAAAVRGDADHIVGHRFQWPLLAALLLWMLRRLMPERSR